MPDESTSQLQALLTRLSDGDTSARDELIDRFYNRLHALAKTILDVFSRVRTFEDTTDVLHDAMPRFLRALRSAPPASVEELFRLAARQIRWELKDLVKHYYGPKGPGGKHMPPDGNGSSASSPPPVEKSESTNDPVRLALWGEFHDRVEVLPDEEREVFDLLWYDGLTQPEAAQIMKVSESTVRRRWMQARVRLQETLFGEEIA